MITRRCYVCNKEVEWVEVCDNSHVVAHDNSHVKACDNSHVVAHDNSHVVAHGSSHVKAWDSSHVVAHGSSHVKAYDSSHVRAYDSSHVVAYDSSHVVAWGNSHVEAWDNSHVEATSPFVTTLVKSSGVQVEGGMALNAESLPAAEWLSRCSVPINKRGNVILYKSLDANYTSFGGFQHHLGRWNIAPDWDATFSGECGRGLHFSPTPYQALGFKSGGVVIAYSVRIEDIADLPAYADSPDKIRARAGFALYRVDKDGKRKKKEDK